MTIVITGWQSRITEEFRQILPTKEVVIHGKPLEPNFPVTAERYFFCHGLLRPKRIADQTDAEIAEGLEVNFHSIACACDRIIETTDFARICIIGSESGYRGSFDENYAAAKAKLHGYIETKELRTPGQQIVGISPGIIEDAGMTLRRTDVENLERRKQEHPKKRFLLAREVAQLAKTLLYFQSDHITGVVIRMHGGLR
ncbi:hypothetical protein MesoLjLc_50700 [Mesorhizobium sp. L-8-10]|uniref:SDR family NAD(P)-dependent oxidoreductase n=1 Tax=Mesorhizobium sp. L-8-10 TaxID=2744523 RepID=UPI001928FF24|nr:SDR family oxidoreductase [Mesorhizobium sp. L-8-10]BCH33140.1 hypothetical protein MesoLjLc_50700 [Mesorhizobium sp. L-8-10]